MSTNTIILIGAGGHGKVVCEAVHLEHPNLEVQIFDDNACLNGMSLLGRQITTPAPSEFSDKQSVHIAIGDNRTRMRIARTCLERGAIMHTVRHPTAVVSPSATIAPGCLIAAGAIVGPEACLGMGVIVNHGAVVDHENCVGNWCHIAPRAVLGGGVILGEGVLIGAGAVVLPGRRVGDWAVVAAGAVVTHDVPAGTTVIGVPARERKE
ncbi:MAG: NeuD/PglB/VioB family sugar acetyltransferase [Nitrospira sp.]|nr:NeuD/PglB/VioB family sugar acetyltransferase [Nitrospira sp.]MCP9463384.1 NeuD/PglB/VioB family sugar acetyltransferase [Nitrospira sp.]